MKITELRKLLNTTSDADLKKSIVEIYELLPKNKKDEADVIIESILKGMDPKKAIPKIDYEELSYDINRFLKNAYEQNYLRPNRMVQKKDRSKWRFLVKNYVKELDNVDVDHPFYDEAITLLTNLYNMMCYACNYYLFSSSDPFQSVGITQTGFYDILAKKVLAKGCTTEAVTNLLVCATQSGLSAMSLNLYQEINLISHLNNSNQLHFSIECANDLITSTKEKWKKLPERSHNRYFLKEQINNLCDFILMSKFELKEYNEETFKYYFDNHIEHDQELNLYCALDLVDEDDDELWIQIYEYGVNKRKIDPRDRLKEMYKDKLKSYNP